MSIVVDVSTTIKSAFLVIKSATVYIPSLGCKYTNQIRKETDKMQNKLTLRSPKVCSKVVIFKQSMINYSIPNKQVNTNYEWIQNPQTVDVCSYNHKLEVLNF